MAEDRKSITPGEGAIKEDSKPTVVWEDSGTGATFVNECGVASVQGEIVLFLGMRQTRLGPQDETRIRLSDCIILNPYVAKRLASALDTLVGTYEAQHGPLRGPSPAMNVPSMPSSRESQIWGAETTDEKASLLLRLVQGLGVEYALERSFKMQDEMILGNRFLLTITKASMSGRKRERLLGICERMGMPDDFLRAFDENLPSANYVHFGFEEAEGSRMYKAYLEFWTSWEDEAKKRLNRSDPFLLHMGFKWDVMDIARRALTNYTCHPMLSMEDIMERLSDIYHGPENAIPLETAKEILELVSTRIGAGGVLYLEVMEEGNPRRSFDLNLYKAKLLLIELYPLLSKTCRHYSIPPDSFRKLYDPVRTKRFGHLSGGMDREGKDFMTIYYGAEGHS